MDGISSAFASGHDGQVSVYGSQLQLFCRPARLECGLLSGFQRLSDWAWPDSRYLQAFK